MKKNQKILRLDTFQLLAALLMRVKIGFPQALWVEQYVEPAPSAVAPVVGDFHIFEYVGVYILLHGPQIEEHRGLQVVEEHAVSLVQLVVALGWNNEGSPVRILKKRFLGRADMFLLLGADEDECIDGKQQAEYKYSQNCIFHTTFLLCVFSDVKLFLQILCFYKNFL